MARSRPARLAPGKRRRTQAERSATTRGKLMDAAIACLLERGWAGTTTTEVARRAGVSRGAQLHHFPTRAAMVAHAVQHLAERWIAHFRRARKAFPPGAGRVDAVMDQLWSAFSGPLFQAAVELWVAARTDAELHATLLATERETGRSIAAFLEEAFGEAAGHPRFPALRRLSLHLVRGMALEAILEPRSRGRRAALGLWKELAAEALAAPPFPSPPAASGGRGPG